MPHRCAHCAERTRKARTPCTAIRLYVGEAEAWLRPAHARKDRGVHRYPGRCVRREATTPERDGPETRGSHRRCAAPGNPRDETRLIGEPGRLPDACRRVARICSRSLARATSRGRRRSLMSASPWTSTDTSLRTSFAPRWTASTSPAAHRLLHPCGRPAPSALRRTPRGVQRALKCRQSCWHAREDSNL